jgi:hypothetical protein
VATRLQAGPQISPSQQFVSVHSEREEFETVIPDKEFEVIGCVEAHLVPAGLLQTYR